MTSRDFAYWLQGYFEIAEPKVLDVKATELVKRHLGLVFKYEKKPTMNFPIWLNGFLEIGKPDELNEAVLNIIKKELNSLFKHEIDPLYGDNIMQHELNSIHNNKPSFLHDGLDDGSLIRC